MRKKHIKGINRLITVILIIVILFSLYRIGTILYGYYEGDRQYAQMEKLAEIDTEHLEGIDFKALRTKNPDVKAWLYSKDTVINYPVVQGKDNREYLYVTALGEWNSKGSLFIDFRCERPFKDFNTIIYGHRMKDGSMFHSLTKYDDPDYFEKHRVMQLFTPDSAFDVEIFAAVRIPADSPLYRQTFNGTMDRESYLRQVFAQSLIETGISVTAEDRMVMLSTCTYEFENARMAVFGKLKERA